MRKTTLARTLGATWPRTHAAAFPINDERRFTAYFGARGGGKKYRARVDQNPWLSMPGAFVWERGDQNTATMPVDPWKSLTPEEILSDIKKLGEACYGVQEEVCKAYERMTGKK